MAGSSAGLADQKVPDTTVFLLADHVHRPTGQRMEGIRDDHAILRNPGIMTLLPTKAVEIGHALPA